MFAKLYSQAVLGLDSFEVVVEVDISQAREFYLSIVGLPDAAVRESRERVMSALSNANYPIPDARILVNLAPADIRKEGAALDLPIALGILAAQGRIDRFGLEKMAFVGELGLDGGIKPAPGALVMANGVKKAGRESLVVPPSMAGQAAVVREISVYPISTLTEAISLAQGEPVAKPKRVNLDEIVADASRYSDDFSDVRGQALAKRGLEIAAAGGHNVCLVGEPGSGKTMLARRLPTILPSMTLEESIETTKIHSIAGELGPDRPLMATRPFRAPHHTISDTALIGGGSVPRPGEVSLAHHGVLFLDEFPEFSRRALETLRQPLEDGHVTIARSRMSVKFPARFILCAAMNPGPDGTWDEAADPSVWSAQRAKKYRSRISGPLLDRIDLHIEAPAVKVSDLSRGEPGEPSEAVRARVEAARGLQRARYEAREGVFCNAHLSARQTRETCRPTEEARRHLEHVIESLGYSARAFDRILKVARTIADLDGGGEEIQLPHIAEAAQYRTLDRANGRATGPGPLAGAP